MLDKLDRAKAGAGQSVWIDPVGYKAALAEGRQNFDAELKREQGSYTCSLLIVAWSGLP
jgi:hypothetical protein